MKREQLPLQQLCTLLNSEFKRQREAADASFLKKMIERFAPGAKRRSWCEKCSIPFPRFAGPGEREMGANWKIDPAPQCPELCHLYIHRAVRELQAKYDLAPSSDRRQ